MAPQMNGADTVVSTSHARETERLATVRSAGYQFQASGILYIADTTTLLW